MMRLALLKRLLPITLCGLVLSNGCIEVPKRGPLPRLDMTEDLDASGDLADMKDASPDIKQEMSCDIEDPQAICKANNEDCGTRIVLNLCGQNQEINCGQCEYPKSCNQNRCVLDCLNDAQLCEQNAAACGPITVEDPCGKMRTVDCGSCLTGAQCTTKDDSTIVCGGCPAAQCGDRTCGTSINTCGNSTSCGVACAGRTTCTDGKRCAPRSITLESSRGSSYFGQAVAIDGLRMAIGASDDNPDGAVPRRGTVFIYERATAQSNWQLAQTINAPDPQVAQTFGLALALKGDTLAVASPYYDARGINNGRVWVYKRTNQGWEVDKTLDTSTTTNNALFGRSICLTDTELFIGEPAPAIAIGRVFVYPLDKLDDTPAVLTETAGSSSQFGHQISCDSGKLVVADPVGDKIGVVYLYEKDSGRWVNPNKISPSNVDLQRFGFSVANFGDEVVISSVTEGAPLYLYSISQDSLGTLPMPDMSANSVLGWTVAMSDSAIYSGVRRGITGIDVYRRNAQQQWAHETRLATAPNNIVGSQLFLDAEQNNVIVGAPLHLGRGYYPGEVLTYTYNPLMGQFDEPQRIRPQQVNNGSFVGRADVVQDGNRWLIGTPDAKFGRGQVSIIEWREDNNDPQRSKWEEISILKEGTAEHPLAQGSGFGTGVLVNEFHLLISASGQSDYALRLPGKVYAYHRQTPTDPWTLTQVLFSPQQPLEATEHLGEEMIWLDANTVLIGAPVTVGENTTNNTGRAYIYRYAPQRNSWELIQKLTPPDSDAVRFGKSLLYDNTTDIIYIGSPDDHNGRVYPVFRAPNDFIYTVSTNPITPPVDAMYQHRQFGASLAKNDRWFAIGDHVGHATTGTAYDGLVHLYTRQVAEKRLDYKSTIGELNTLKRMRFGHSLAFYGDRLYVGRPYDTNSTYNLSGSIQRFNLSGAQWLPGQLIYADDLRSSAYFGWSIVSTPSHLVVGTPGNPDRGLRAGGLYMFDLP